MKNIELEFTGERFMPSRFDNIFLEHIHRYHMAKQLAVGKIVLDIASGEGYGSDLLASVASRVIGVDISEDAVAHASGVYTRDNLEFHVGSCTDIPLPDHCVDVVVSFETLEHIDAHELMMTEIKRVLRPDGCLILSTPEKGAYTDATGLVNPFHVKELYRHEFDALMRRHFRAVAMHGQRIGFGSFIVSEIPAEAAYEIASRDGVSQKGLVAPLYLIAVGSDDPAKSIGITSLFSQDIMSSEPVLKRVEFEKRQWDEEDAAGKAWEDWHRRELERERLEIRSQEAERLYQLVVTLRQSAWTARSSSWKIVRRLVTSSLLKELSKLKLLSKRRRKRLAQSAAKRDPRALARQVAQFNQLFEGVIQTRGALGFDTRMTGPRRPPLTVSAVVPNFNHGRFLRQRLDSILSQTYPVMEIVVLDDASTDDSRIVIQEYVLRYPQRVRTVYNETRSGNVFDQWRKGHEAAKGDLVWICESDDSCEPDFLERMIPHFSDSSVLLAFGRIQFIDDTGRMRPGLDQYRESAEPGIWNSAIVRPAHEWFAGAFGVKNVIANVGGSLWRRFDVAPDLWEVAKSFRVMGDWYLYLGLARGGGIAYEPAAVSYFRIHQTNTSVAAQKTASYYQEYSRLMMAIRDRWDIPDATLQKFVNSCREVFQAASPEGCDFETLVRPGERLLARPRQMLVLMGFLGFYFGGGELFPINLANALHRRGVMVSMLQLWDREDDPAVREMLDTGIPVYTSQMLREAGVRRFLARAGVSVVHSHVASTEALIFSEADVATPFVATLHGSYEAMNIPPRDIESWSRKVSLFAYTTDRNLEPFGPLGARAEKFRKLRNAMPLDTRSFPSDRKALDISESAIVFAFVARGIEGKGWQEAVRAFAEFERRHPGQEAALLMVGEGEEMEKARALANGDPRIRFLGFQQRIHGLYRLSDIALIPTRFAGESYPLCLIQSLQVGVPAIATDVGEIRGMLEMDGKRAGLLLPYNADDDKFVAEIVEAMTRMLDRDTRRHCAEAARLMGASYDIDGLCETYVELYAEAAARHAAGRPG